MQTEKRRPLALIGAPFNGLATPTGRERTAESLRDAITELCDPVERGLIVDRGDLEIRFTETPDRETGILDLGPWRSLTRALSEEIAASMSSDALLLVLGGDCAVLPGVVRGIQSRVTRPGLVYLDGHADYHTVSTSPTGDPADLVLAAMTGRAGVDLERCAPEIPRIGDESVVVVGARSLEEIRSSSIPVLGPDAVHNRGAEHVAGTVVELLSDADGVWIHLDVDVLDPAIVTVLFPEADGLDFTQVGSILRHVAADLPIIGMDVCCYHPALDGGAASHDIASLVLGVWRES